MQFEPENPNHIFVFGSNMQGRHGKGAALHARINYDAEYGIGIGRTGRAYAIPTKITPYITNNIQDITEHVHDFLSYARAYTELSFFVTAIGCGLAGYTPEQIAPLFQGHPSNVYFLDERFNTILKGL